jgi:hypothetical protein
MHRLLSFGEETLCKITTETILGKKWAIIFFVMGGWVYFEVNAARRVSQENPIGLVQILSVTCMHQSLKLTELTL